MARSSPLVLFSRPVCRGAPLPRSTRTPAGGRAHHARDHGAHSAPSDARDARGVPARCALGVRGPPFRAPGVLGFAALFSPFRARRSLAPPRALALCCERARDAHGARRTRRARRAGSPRAARSFDFAACVSRFARPGRSLGGRSTSPSPLRRFVRRSVRAAEGARSVRADARRTRRAAHARERGAGSPSAVRPLARSALPRRRAGSDTRNDATAKGK